MSLPSHACDPLVDSSGKVFSSRFEMIFVLLVLAVWCWVDVWPRGKLDPNNPGEHRTDFTVYTAAGKAAISGQSPYSVSNARGWTYLYMPLFSLLVAPLSFLSEGIQCAVWFWISIACLYGALLEFNKLNKWAFPGSTKALEIPDLDNDPNAAGRLATSTTPPSILNKSILNTARAFLDKVLGRFSEWGGIVCVTGFSLSSLNCLQRGQVGLLQFYLSLLGARMILQKPRRTSVVVGGVVLASAIVLKLSPALPTAVLLIGLLFKTLGSKIVHAAQSIERPLFMSLGLFFGLGVGIWILPSAILGWQANQSYLNEWRRDVLSRSNQLSKDPFAGDSHSLRNQSPMNGFWLMGNAIVPSDGILTMDQPVGQLVLKWVRWIAILMMVIAVVAILSHGKERNLLIAFAVANAATLLVIPIARGHYFMAMWPAAVWVPRWLMLSNPGRFQMQSGLIGFIPPILLILHYSFEYQIGALGVLGVGAWFWFALLTATATIDMVGKKRSLGLLQRNHET